MWKTKKRQILLGLVIILAMSVIYRFMRPFEQETVDRLTYGRTTRVTTDNPQPLDSPEGNRTTQVMTALLTQPPAMSDEVRRNPFQMANASRATENVEAPVAAAPPPTRRSAQDRIREALQQFKRFGDFRRGKERYIFLERGKQVLVVRQGDVIDGKYKVEAIGDDTISVTTAENPEPVEVGLEDPPPDY